MSKENSIPPITIYTDGSCDKNPGPGGWAALIRQAGQERLLSGSEPATTNNRMELRAALEALQSLSTGQRVRLHTDSNYLKRGIEEWLPAWRARNWKRKGGKLANVDLWKALDKAARRHSIEWRWVKGHAGNRNNQRVDRLARQAMQSISRV